MRLENCPVSLVDFKKHLRVDGDLLDDDLQDKLVAAAEYVEGLTLIDFKTDYVDDDIPYAIKAAILMTAGRLFEAPTDAIFEKETAVMNLVKPYKKWDRMRR